MWDDASSSHGVIANVACADDRLPKRIELQLSSVHRENMRPNEAFFNYHTARECDTSTM